MEISDMEICFIQFSSSVSLSVSTLHPSDGVCFFIFSLDSMCIARILAILQCFVLLAGTYDASYHIVYHSRLITLV